MAAGTFLGVGTRLAGWPNGRTQAPDTWRSRHDREGVIEAMLRAEHWQGVSQEASHLISPGCRLGSLGRNASQRLGHGRRRSIGWRR
jgi:hypothetical protein